MSVSNTRRRLSLLTGSALLALAGAASLAPSAAFAANECGDPNANVAAADIFTCTGSFAAITYPVLNGALTLNLQNNVTTTTGGLVVTAGANAVTIARIADSPANSGDLSLTSTSGAGLSVISAAGAAIGVNLNDNDTTDTPMAVSGTSAGVLLQNAGTAATTFTSTNGAISASAGSGIDVTSLGTGAITVTNGSAVTGSTWGVRLGTTGAGNVSFTNNGTAAGTTGALLVTGGTNATITNSPTIVVNGTTTANRTLSGVVTLNNTGTVGFTNGGIWTSTGTSFLGAGATTLTNSLAANESPAGLILTNAGGAATTLDFGGGADTFANAGILAPGGAEGAATLILSGLETWNNTGRVVFGANADVSNTDGAANDRIVSAGTLFTGSAVSTFLMDVDFSADQAGCAAAVTADCLDLRGSSTAGTTSIIVNTIGNPLAMADRIVLVDVAGAGTSAAGHFTLSTQSPDYRLVGTAGTVETGLYFYTLGYDATAKQHVLTAAAFNGKSRELSRIGTAASEPWRAATGLWEARQTDLRDTLAGRSADSAPGVWLKVAGNLINEVRRDVIDAGFGTTAYNTSSQQRTTAIVGGVDLVRAVGDDSAWVLGLTAGKLNSSLDYTVATSELELDGHSFGAYASFITGRLYVDAIVNTTSFDLTDTDLGQSFEGAATSLGYQIEAGWRQFQINDGAYIEPLAAVTYIKTKVDDLAVGPVGAAFGDAVSLRAALGMRVSGDVALEAVTAKLSFTGRLWKELEGDNATTLSASFGSATLMDQGLDTLGDVGVAIGFFKPGGRLSANLGYALKFNEGYESSDASVSVRFAW